LREKRIKKSATSKKSCRLASREKIVGVLFYFLLPRRKYARTARIATRAPRTRTTGKPPCPLSSPGKGPTQYSLIKRRTGFKISVLHLYLKEFRVGPLAELKSTRRLSEFLHDDISPSVLKPIGRCPP
jgi:hypothetical protein